MCCEGLKDYTKNFEKFLINIYTVSSTVTGNKASNDKSTLFSPKSNEVLNIK